MFLKLLVQDPSHFGGEFGDVSVNLKDEHDFLGEIYLVGGVLGTKNISCV